MQGAAPRYLSRICKSYEIVRPCKPLFLWKVPRKFGCPTTLPQSCADSTMAWSPGSLLRWWGHSRLPSESWCQAKMCPCVCHLQFLSRCSTRLAYRSRFSLGDGVPITYSLDGNLFNLRRIKAMTRISTTIISDLWHADDAAIEMTQTNCSINLKLPLQPISVQA